VSTPTGPRDGNQLRASDADRRSTGERLSRALAAGEISEQEYAERSATAQGARTRGELSALTNDLADDRVAQEEPWPARARTPAPYERGRRRGVAELASGWRSWAATAVVLTVIWGVASLSAGHLTGYWPVWPLGFWGAALIITGIRGSRGDD
jgi:hypothetical protein